MSYNKTNLVRRTQVDFKNHVHTVMEHKFDDSKYGTVRIDDFKRPDSSTCSIKFINAGGILAVTGDYGNWIFCREFHPSADGYVLDHYWYEELRTLSCQEAEEFDEKVAVSQINEYLNEHDDLSDEEVEFWERLIDSCGSEYEFIAEVMDRPSCVEAEAIPRGKRPNFGIEAIFDAFDEICMQIS